MKFHFHKILLAATLLLPSLSIYADEIEEAESLIKNGDVAGAKTILEGLKNSPEAHTLLGRIAFLDYDFEEASRLYRSAAQLYRKQKKELPAQLEKYEEEIRNAEGYLERVEDIVVVDSIVVDKNEFLSAYRLPHSAGSLNNGEEFPIEGVSPDYFYQSEDGDYLVWSEPRGDESYHLMESIRLTDGKWQAPEALDDALSENGNAMYPFMMADGVTLYYASDGDGSMGGLDIFVASRDSSSGDFLQPQNIGMPYNSPADDYLLAIDELNGIGWWATDRNLLGDKITIYTYLTSDLRKNHDPEREDIVDLARISDLTATRPEDLDLSQVRETIAAIEPGKKHRKADFHFRVSPDKEYTSFDQLQTSDAQTAMKLYLKAETKQNEDLASLRELRRSYAKNPTQQLKSDILQLEKATEDNIPNLRKLKNAVYQALAR